MVLLGVDIGTTNCKAGIVTERGDVAAIATGPTIARQTAEGWDYYDPAELWENVAALMKEAVNQAEGMGPVASIGITSMAEAGLLVNRANGQPISHIVPWYDRRSMPQYERIRAESDVLERFCKTGLHGSFKYGLSKILWLREQSGSLPGNAVWLSVADFIAYRLSGRMATDDTLAARTYAYDIRTRQWDRDWIARFGLAAELFPDVHPSGHSLGTVSEDIAVELGVGSSTTVSVAGHDHLCASFAARAVRPDTVFNSIGTAETLIGILPDKELGQAEFESGLSFGRHVAPGMLFWMGGLSASGGSVEWIRHVLDESVLSYRELEKLVALKEPGPTELIYVPYLSGSGAPKPNPRAKGAFVGLQRQHGRADLAKAVLEGVAYEMEAIRRAAEQVTREPVRRIVSIGGGTRNRTWMSIKADVSGCPHEISSLEEAALVGAALLAAVGAGIFASATEAVAAVRSSVTATMVPDQELHVRYRNRYERAYEPLQKPLRQYYEGLEREGRS
jgi:xylulokinase